MSGRNITGSDPVSKRATGLWFRVPGQAQALQRYDEAPPHDGTVHWYLGSSGWHAFHVGDVRQTKKGE